MTLSGDVQHEHLLLHYRCTIQESQCKKKKQQFKKKIFFILNLCKQPKQHKMWLFFPVFGRCGLSNVSWLVSIWADGMMAQSEPK